MKLLAQLWSTLVGGEDSSVEPLLHAGGGARGERVRVFVDAVTIGYLEEAAQHFVFRYADEYKQRPGAVPISAFPDLAEVYESKDLWPFFAVRLPPAKRPDVRELIESKKLTELRRAPCGGWSSCRHARSRTPTGSRWPRSALIVTNRRGVGVGSLTIRSRRDPKKDPR